MLLSTPSRPVSKNHPCPLALHGNASPSSLLKFTRRKASVLSTRVSRLVSSVSLLVRPSPLLSTKRSRVGSKLSRARYKRKSWLCFPLRNKVVSALSTLQPRAHTQTRRFEKKFDLLHTSLPTLRILSFVFLNSLSLSRTYATTISLSFTCSTDLVVLSSPLTSRHSKNSLCSFAWNTYKDQEERKPQIFWSFDFWLPLRCQMSQKRQHAGKSESKRKRSKTYHCAKAILSIKYGASFKIDRFFRNGMLGSRPFRCNQTWVEWWWHAPVVERIALPRKYLICLMRWIQSLVARSVPAPKPFADLVSRELVSRCKVGGQRRRGWKWRPKRWSGSFYCQRSGCHQRGKEKQDFCEYTNESWLWYACTRD